MPVTIENVGDVFTYHPPDEAQQLAFLVIREGALSLALIILEFTPPCADREAALRLLRQCVMTVNAAIALKGKV